MYSERNFSNRDAGFMRYTILFSLERNPVNAEPEYRRPETPKVRTYTITIVRGDRTVVPTLIWSKNSEIKRLPAKPANDIRYIL
jgi:hypothetical protein